MTCVCEILTEFTKRRQEHQAPDIPGASSSGRQVATEDLSSGRKVHLRHNTDGEQYIKKFDDPAKNFMPQSEEEHECCNQEVLNSF